ncbi:serine hydrolase domain-containing protein [Liquorilactobacillus oeni]|nr:serine hydrolase domain-containing protein [Liquorilactobacillus oeni]
MKFFNFKNKRVLMVIFLALFLVLGIIFSICQLEGSQSSVQVHKKDETKASIGSNHIKRPQKNNAAALSVKNEPTIVKNHSLDNFFSHNGFIGSVIIVQNNQVVLERGYGYADTTQKRNNTSNSLFLIGSTEKAMIATSILQLKEKGKLNLDDPIAKYYPNFPNGQKIKLRNLLTHTSGINGRAETFSKKTPKELLQEIIANGIRSQPGQWHYLDANYIVLADLVVKLSSQSLREYLKQHIFQPSRLEHTGFADANFFKKQNSSLGYVKQHYLTDTQTEKLPEFSQLYGVGDMYMDPADMYRFDQALNSGKLISQKDLQTMFTPGSSSHYGMGFYNDPGLIVNRGFLSGFSISNGFTHDKKDFIVLFSNVKDDKISLGTLNGHILALLNSQH